MRKTTLLGLLPLLLALASTAEAQTAQDLFPNHDGNTWTYEVTGALGGGANQDIRIDRRSGGWARIDGNTAIEGFDGRWFWVSGASARIWAWNETTSDYSLVYNLGVGQGNTFTPRIGTPTAGCLNGTTWEVSDEHATVNTPVGTFNDCVIIRNIQPVCADAGTSEMVFAPSVGLIRYSWQTFAGGQTATVVHAMVDGREYRRQTNVSGGLTSSLKIDKFTYAVTENRMPIVPPGGRPLMPETLELKFEVKNETAESVAYLFSSGQSFDYIVRDESGNEVYRWSNGRFFTMALRQLTLLPGETWNYDFSLELRDNNGDALTEGNYTLEAVQTAGLGSSVRPHAMKAVVGFKIERQIVY